MAIEISEKAATRIRTLSAEKNTPKGGLRLGVKGKSVDEALTIKNTDVAHELNLPPVKIHCSVLAEDAIKAAVADYQKKHGKAPTVRPNTVQGDRGALVAKGVLKSGL